MAVTPEFINQVAEALDELGYSVETEQDVIDDVSELNDDVTLPGIRQTGGAMTGYVSMKLAVLYSYLQGRFAAIQSVWNSWFGTDTATGVQGEWQILKVDVQTATTSANNAASASTTATAGAERVNAGLQGFTVSSPNFCLADQITDMWGGGGVAITGPNHKKEREWYIQTQMPVVAYSSLGHGMFTGRMKASDEARAAEFLDEFAMKGYACPENFERLRRVEILSKEKGASVPQIAMSWLFRQKINVFAVVATTKASRMQENIEALKVQLTEEECRYLDLETDTL